jgi:hypothetical protein
MTILADSLFAIDAFGSDGDGRQGQRADQGASGKQCFVHRGCSCRQVRSGSPNVQRLSIAPSYKLVSGRERLSRYRAHGANQNIQEGDLSNATRESVADDAGLCEHRPKTALRLVNVPADGFADQIESDEPPTFTGWPQRASAVRLVLVLVLERSRDRRGNRIDHRALNPQLNHRPGRPQLALVGQVGKA